MFQSQFYAHLIHSTELKHFACKTKGIDQYNVPRFPFQRLSHRMEADM